MPKINQLPRAQTLAGTDLLAKENTSGTSTEGVSASQIADYVKSTEPSLDTTLTQEGHPADAKAVGDALADKQDELTFDSTPTANSQNPVTSGGIKSALDQKQGYLTFDDAPTAGSNNPVKSKGIKSALDTKQNNLTFDSAPTAGSSNPVTSAGIKMALDAKQNNLTFDNVPTNGSNNPVKSDGVFDADEAIRADVTDLKNAFNELTTKDVSFVDGYSIDYRNGKLDSSHAETYSYAELDVATIAGSTLSGHTSCEKGSVTGLAFYDGDDKYINGITNPNSGIYSWDISVQIPVNAYVLRVSCRTDYKSDFYLVYSWDRTNQNLENGLYRAHENSVKIDIINDEILLTKKAMPVEYRQGWWGASSGGPDPSHTNAICSKEYIQHNVRKISVDNAYKFRLQAWVISNGSYVGIWNGTQFVKQNPEYYLQSIDMSIFASDFPTYGYKIVCYKNDGTSDINPLDATNIIYVVSKLEEESYNFTNFGEKVNTKSQGFNVFSAIYDLPAPGTYGASARQDFDIYDGILFQMMSNNTVVLVNLETGSVIANYSIYCGHGNACQFGKILESVSDEYPPLYCFDYASNRVYKNKVTSGGATLTATYLLGNDGYRFSGGYDSDNNFIVSINYAQDSSTSATDNYMTFSIWDLNNLTEEEEGVYSPALLKSRQFPFIPVVQGCTIFRNRLFVTSGKYPDAPIKIYVFNYDGVCTSIIDDFPTSIQQSEAEGIAFYKNGKDYDCYFSTFYHYRMFFEQ